MVGGQAMEEGGMWAAAMGHIPAGNGQASGTNKSILPVRVSRPDLIAACTTG